MLAEAGVTLPPEAAEAERLENEGKTLLFVAVDGTAAGVARSGRCPRPEAPEALAAVCGAPRPLGSAKGGAEGGAGET